jgi:two-component system cell cycle sensor histidine kinase/response regulator CckA
VKDGTEKVGYVFSEPRHQDGAVIGATALIVDMTRERKLEQELQRAQRLELIGRVASGIAHDFNNFLTVVLTLAELLRRGLTPADPMQDDLRKIIQAGEQAANLANQLLTFGKQRRVVPRRVDVNRVATRTLELLRATLPRGIQVEAVLAEGEMRVQSDEMQLQQVLMNLCLNARDAMPKGGCLEVRTSAVNDAESRWILLSVKDNGEGIPPEMLGQIFEAFYTTKERGSGLGLAMVRQIIESNGGRVEVSSRLGEGARFDVWLPADR